MIYNQLSQVQSCRLCKHAEYHEEVAPTFYDPGEPDYCECTNSQIEWTEELDKIVEQDNVNCYEVLPNHCGGYERADLLTLWRRFTQTEVPFKEWAQAEGVPEEEIEQSYQILKEEIEREELEVESIYKRAYREFIPDLQKEE